MPKNRICNFAAVAMLVLAVLGAIAVHAQTYTDIYNLGTNKGDPQQPVNPGIIAQGRDGNLYSTALRGGANGDGAVFKITPDGKLTVLHSFDGNDGNQVFSGLTLGTDGNFYGTTQTGGSAGVGTVFKISPNGKFTVLHNFAGGSDGGLPYAPPIQGTDGNFYGTTSTGYFNPGGTIYRITSFGTLTTLYQFCCGGSASPLVLGTDGNFYGVGPGGVNDKGTIFKMTPKGKVTVIHSLSCNTACAVFAPLMQASDGYFYGAAVMGGTSSGRPGTIFRISSTGKFTVLYSFTGGSDGCQPFAGLVQATDGNFYGTAGCGADSAGTIYQITPEDSFSILYNFDIVKGGDPRVTLMQHTNGVLYGDTVAGGVGGGVFYSMDVGLGPFVTLLPYSGKVGKTIQILGQGFIGTTAVSFNGTAASYTVKSETFLTAIVPVGATTGFVTVTTPGGPLTSNKQFIVKP